MIPIDPAIAVNNVLPNFVRILLREEIIAVLKLIAVFFN